MRRKHSLTSSAYLVVLVALFGYGCIPLSNPFDEALIVDWEQSLTRDWAGSDFWANRLQDWRVQNGRLETTEAAAGRPMRTLHVLTRRVGDQEGDVQMVTRGAWVGAGSEAGGAGFLIGAGGEVDYRAAALIHHSAGNGAGLAALISGGGDLLVLDLEAGPDTLAIQPLSTPVDTFHLEFSAFPDGDAYQLAFSVFDGIQRVDSLVVEGVSGDRLTGNVALVAHLDRFSFDNFVVAGSRLEQHLNRNAGPVLGTQYTLSKGTMKMTAQLMPLGPDDNHSVRLEINRSDGWEIADEAPVILSGYTATFRVDDWDATEDVPYRVVYDLANATGGEESYNWKGVIKKDPVDQNIVSVAGFTGNHNTARGVEGGRFDWTTQVWFPHNDIVEHVANQDVDVLFFSGDQVYEGASPTFPDRENAHLDYLYKWNLWVWAFRDITRDRPTITIPDDHDVYQGNVWGGGGGHVDLDVKGGYTMPLDWVNMIQRTQTSHFPDPYDPTPIMGDVSVYYTGMTYGRIGFAIIEDRKFKSGCYDLVPGKEGRHDHFPDPDFDPAIVDLPGLTLLGDRQITFLEDWTSNWQGEDMKLAVSQTVFANMATHHGGNLMRLYGDLDSNGWPKKGRDRALNSLRKGFAFMLQGDQHLSTIVHHGVESHNDAGYSFCVPSIANFYPRGWQPEVEGQNRPEGAPAHYGEHQDAFGNFVTVYGATNPTSLTGVSTGKAPLNLHDRMPGHGVVRFNKAERTITMENWPRYADPQNPSTGSQYEGWPKTIEQMDNYGREAVAYLPEIQIAGGENAVVQIIEEATGEVVYAIRISGSSFKPKVFADGTYTIRVSMQEEGDERSNEVTGVQAIPESDDAQLEINLMVIP